MPTAHFVGIKLKAEDAPGSEAGGRLGELLGCWNLICQLRLHQRRWGRAPSRWPLTIPPPSPEDTVGDRMPFQGKKGTVTIEAFASDAALRPV